MNCCGRSTILLSVTKIDYNVYEQFRGAIVHLSLDCSVKYDEICDVYFIPINREVSFALKSFCTLTLGFQIDFLRNQGL